MTVAELAVPHPEPGDGWIGRRGARLIGWSAFAFGTVFRLITLWFVARIGPGSVHMSLGISGATFIASDIVGTAAAIVGAVIVARRPSNPIAWLYVLAGVVQGILTCGTAWFAAVGSADAGSPGFVYAWLSGVVDYSIPFSFAAFVLALFPDGHAIGPRWRAVVALAIVGQIVRALEVGFGEPTTLLVGNVANPYRIPGAIGDALETSARIGIGSLMVESALLLASVSLALRYRQSPIDGRRQIRWIVFAGFVAVLGAVPLTVSYFRPDALRGVDVISVLFLAVSAAPIATLIAITRYRLYEIDRIVNRALLYGSLTAVLAGVFTAGIGLAQRLFVLTTGVTSDAAIVLTTLVVATLYAPLRKRLEAFVDRRFKYEARFGAYGQELEAVLSVVDPELAARRLVTEAVAELAADGGAVLGVNGSVTASAGRWPGVAAERIAIEGGHGQLATIVLAPRANGEPFAAGDLEALRRVAALAARAIGRAR